MNNTRTKISEWVDKVFGGIHYSDFFHMNEIGEWDKEKNPIQHIIVELRKNQAWQKEWTKEETTSQWEEMLLEIIGKDNLLKFELKSSEANEMKTIGSSFISDKPYSSITSQIFGYRFRLEFQKKYPRERK